MSRLTSFLNICNKIVAIYCLLASTVFLWPLSGYLLVFGAIMTVVQKGRKRLTTLGSACWAEATDLKRAGMLGATSGLILGRLPEQVKRRKSTSGKEAEWVRLPQAVHTAVFAPTGVGKGVSLVTPFLLTSPESAVVLDFKAELAGLTAEYRRKKFGHQVVLIDPYRSFTAKPDTYNPLDAIGKDDPLAIDDCNDLANAVVVRTGRETEAHWNDLSEVLTGAVSGVVVGYGEPGTRSLQTVREIISSPALLDTAVKLMLESEKWNGSLKSLGGQIQHLEGKEKASVLSSAARHLRFLGSPAISDSIGTSSFDPTLLRRGRMTVYLILPPDRAHAQSGLLRLWVSSLLRSCVRGGLQ